MTRSRSALRRIHEIYKQYKFLTHANEGPFNDLARTEYCPNAFLVAFSKSKETLLNAAGVIKDMQHSIVADPILGCAPTVRSYSIFLHGFTSHGEMKLAEQVLTFMRGKGMEPNEVTWTTLLAGYARAQDVEGLVDAVRRFEQSGYVWDQWTYGALARLQDVRKYRDLVKGKANALKLDFTEDLKTGLDARISAAEQEEVDGEEVWGEETLSEQEQEVDDVKNLETASEQRGSPRMEVQSDQQPDGMDALKAAAAPTKQGRRQGNGEGKGKRRGRRGFEQPSDWESDG